jgi:glucokinase
MKNEARHVVGVDLGGTTVKAGIVSYDGDIVLEHTAPTEADQGPEHVTANIVRVIREVLDKTEDKNIRGIGVASPGIVSLDGNTIEAPPNFKGWDSFPLRNAVQRGLGEKFRVSIENDANAAAIAEAKFGAGRGEKDFLFVIWGTGIGGGIIMNGEIYHGPHGGAGEFGHGSIDYNGPPCNCGNIGCIESYIGQRYLSSRAAKMLEERKDSLVWKLVDGDAERIEPKILHDAAMKGDEAAHAIMAEAGELLGVAISSFMNIMNYHLAIVGGGISAAGDLVFQPMNESVRKRVMAPLRPIARVIPAEMGNRAGILGAAGLVM